MNKRAIIVFSVVALAIGTPLIAARIIYQGRQQAVTKEIESFVKPTTSTMRIDSPAFGQNEPLPIDYTCDGKNISPTLRLTGVPEEAKSVALICDDPDAIMGTWTHWVVWNILPTVTVIPEGKIPDGAVAGLTSFGRNEYGGPCPPSGTHHYFFKAYALDAILDLPVSTDAAGLEAAMSGHVIDKAGLIGTYGH
jgi:Raf kinase inhibitor-like YbhB/YbcL family protein